MQNKYREQWDERNIKFQRKDRYASVAFADERIKRNSKLEVAYLVLLISIGAYVWLM